MFELYCTSLQHFILHSYPAVNLNERIKRQTQTFKSSNKNFLRTILTLFKKQKFMKNKRKKVVYWVYLNHF